MAWKSRIPVLSALLVFLLAHPISGCAAPVASERGADVRNPWTEYFGGHYRQRVWAGSIRDYKGPKSAGIAFPANGHQGQGVVYDDLLGINRVITNIGGLDSGRNNAELAAFMNAIEQDAGKGWRSAVYHRTLAYARQLGGSGLELYWQFGNEINSKQFSRAFHLWAKDGGRIKDHDLSTIGWYVEYYLAPGLMAIKKAETEKAVVKPINVVLGSVAAAYNPKAQRFLNALLEYEIKGDYAQGLRGRRVWEVIDSVSIHYLIGSPGSVWHEMLTDFHEKWISSGRVRTIWSTEEIGIQKAREGYGAGQAAKVWARSLHWWMDMGVPPEQGQVFLWGSERGGDSTSADSMLERLYDFLGDARLEKLDSRVLDDGRGELEYYRFASIEVPEKQVVVVFPRYRSGGVGRSIPLSSTGPCPGLKVRYLQTGSDGNKSQIISARNNKEQSFLMFDNGLKLNYATAAVFFVEGPTENACR